MILTTILIVYALVSIAASALFGTIGYARGPVRTNNSAALARRLGRDVNQMNPLSHDRSNAR